MLLVLTNTLECINLDDGISMIFSHSLFIKLYFSTEDKGKKSNPPNT